LIDRPSLCAELGRADHRAICPARIGRRPIRPFTYSRKGGWCFERSIWGAHGTRVIVELSPNEETALQRVAQGMMLTMNMEVHHLVRLKQLALIEETGKNFKLTGLGRRRLEMRGAAPPKAD
jgi:hypothetical protein